MTTHLDAHQLCVSTICDSSWNLDYFTPITPELEPGESGAVVPTPYQVLHRTPEAWFRKPRRGERTQNTKRGGELSGFPAPCSPKRGVLLSSANTKAALGSCSISSDLRGVAQGQLPHLWFPGICTTVSTLAGTKVFSGDAMLFPLPIRQLNNEPQETGISPGISSWQEEKVGSLSRRKRSRAAVATCQTT